MVRKSVVRKSVPVQVRSGPPLILHLLAMKNGNQKFKSKIAYARCMDQIVDRVKLLIEILDEGIRR